MALLAPDIRLLTADGRRAEGTDAVRDLVGNILSMLRSTTHVITAQWHQDNVWIAEVDATYELEDWRNLNALPRAVVLRDGRGGIGDVRVYGAHESSLTDRRAGEEGLRIGERWIPPL